MTGVLQGARTNYMANKTTPQKEDARWRHLPVMCLVAWCILGVLLRSAPSATVLTSLVSHDCFIPVSGAWALESGLKIHTDFSTPLGIAYYLPYYWAIKIFGNTHAVIRHGASLIFVVLSIMSFFALRPPRFSWRLTAIGVALVSLFGTNPCFLSEPPFVIAEGMAYNRIGIALGYLCLLIAAFPVPRAGNSTNRVEMIEALILALAIVWSFYSKATYAATNVFLIVVGLGVAWLLKAPRSWRFYAWLVCSALVMAGLISTIWHVDHAKMFDDIRMASASRSRYVFDLADEKDLNGLPYWGLPAFFLRATKVVVTHQLELGLLAGLVVLGLGRSAVHSEISLKQAWLYFALVVTVLAVDIMQNLFNGYSQSLPMIPLMWLVLVCVFDRQLTANPPVTLPQTARIFQSLIHALGLVVVGGYTLYQFTSHVTECYYNVRAPQWFVKVNPASLFKADERIQTKGWEGFYLVRAGEQEKYTNSFAGRINKGLTLLRKHDLADKKIVVMDYANPFPFFLGSPYPAGQPIWMHAEATFSYQNHLPPETVFRDAEVILIPKQPLSQYCEGVLLNLYGGYLGSRYVEVAQDDGWAVYRRK